MAGSGTTRQRARICSELTILTMEEVWISLQNGDEEQAESPPKEELLKGIVELLVGDISNPPPIVDIDGVVTLHPKMFISAVGGSKIFSFLKPEVFFGASLSLQLTSIKAFQTVLSQDTYAVTNFQNGQGLHLVSLLMELITQLLYKLDKYAISSDDIDIEFDIAKELCKLVGTVGAAGITSHDLKSYMKILASAETPPKLRSSLLSTLPLLAGAPFYDKLVPSWRRRTNQLPPPAAFFSINGHADSKSGIKLPFEQWPFENEYQVTMWIRFERLPVSGSTVLVFALSSEEDGSGLVLSADSSGVLSLRVGDSGVIAKTGSPPSSYRCGGVMLKHWHFLSLTHSKPRRGALAMFQKDSLTLSLDHKCVLSVAVPVPKQVNSPLDRTVIAQGLQGHIGEIHIFQERLTDAQVSVLASHSRVRPADACSCDLEAVKGLKLTKSMMLAVYHPQRTLGTQVIDIHGHHHAQLQGLAHTYQLAAAQTALDNIGGALILTPLICSLIGAAPVIDVEGHNIASRLEAIAAFLVGQPSLQREMMRSRFADMLEFALFHLSPQQLVEEDPVRCVSAIESLVSVSQGNLFDTLVTRFFFNLRLFAYGAPFKLQKCLLEAYRAFVRAQPIAFRKLVGVSRLLGAMSELYRDQLDLSTPTDVTGGGDTADTVPFKALQDGGLGRRPRRITDNVLTKEERTKLRHLLLSVIFESFVSPAAVGVNTEEYTRAILQFLSNPFPDTPSPQSEASITTDVSCLLLSLARRSTPPVGLYPSLNVISEHQPTNLCAVVKARMLTNGDDSTFAIGLRLLSTYVSRIGVNQSTIQGLLQSSASSVVSTRRTLSGGASSQTSNNKLSSRFYTQGLDVLTRSLEQHQVST